MAPSLRRHDLGQPRPAGTHHRGQLPAAPQVRRRLILGFAVSYLLHAWGSAGKYTLLAELLPGEQRPAANTLVSSLDFTATIAGPTLAGSGLVTVALGAVAVVLLLARRGTGARVSPERHLSRNEEAPTRGRT
ncbi:hypothetical protein [Nonomuraea sp. NPDC050643]|uniref:hypothetical protein n=1 Tax=Nonomuraea sp. NPDC050643 TaxID=3155660 RepID=UPI0033FE34E4